MQVISSYILGTSYCQHIIIIHGLFGTGKNWWTFAKRWADQFGLQVHLIDLRNHGKSFWSPDMNYSIMSQDLFNYMSQHEIPKAILLGHSVGGKVAMQFATNYPNLVEKLMIVDIAPRRYKSRYERIFVGLELLMRTAPQSRLEADQLMTPYSESKALRQFLLRNLFYNQNRNLEFSMNVKVLKQQISKLLGPPDLSGCYSGKSWFVWGEFSDYFQENDRQLIQSFFPNAKMFFVSDANHWVHVDNRKEFAQIVNGFIHE